MLRMHILSYCAEEMLLLSACAAVSSENTPLQSVPKLYEKRIGLIRLSCGVD